jgi:tight adherence protein B
VTLLAGCLVGLTVWFGERAVHQASHVRAFASFDRGERAEPRGPRRVFSLDRRWWWAVAGGLAGYLVGHVFGALLGVISVLPLRRVLLRGRRAAVAAERDEQLADAVGSAAAALRAGMSVPQALDYAADETPKPLGDSLRGLVDELSLGVSLEAAVDTWAARTDTEDARLLAGVLGLHRRSGGDLPAVLDQVVAALRDRRAAAREVRALTAQARLSGAILGLLPIGFFGFLWLTSRQDIQGALRNPAGLAAMGIGLGLEGLAFLWIRSLLAVR